MKQHITIEQWEELNKDQKCKLYDYFWGDSIDFLVSRDERQLKTQLSIGQMIEFLDENTKWYIRIGHWMDPGKTTDIGWIVGDYGIDEYFDGKSFWNKEELCDALWEAVKEVL